MINILTLLPVLACAIGMNIVLGMYYNIGVKKFSFNIQILLTGILKALIIAGTFMGLAYCFYYIDFRTFGVTPQFILNSAITLYVGKVLVSLGKILGLELNPERTDK
ncbi:MAG: hypothetical protein HFI34_10665 [Lachnospiraceae bacterium]|nr:hypothetical protein [Lachnospiraceae bacterium]